MASSSSSKIATPRSESSPGLSPPSFDDEDSLAPHVASIEAWSQSVQKFPHEWYHQAIQSANRSATLQGFLTEKSNQYDFLEAEHNNIRSQLQTSNNENIASRATIASLRQQINDHHHQPTAQREARSEKLPDIPKFSGKKDELREWVTQLNLKLFVNQDRFTNPKAGLLYAISRLEGRAMAQVQPYVKSHNEVSIPDVAGLLAMLERAFGDPDKKATAQRELRSLRQANKEFHVYLSDFQRIAPDTNFDEEAMRSALLEGISDELKQLMVTQITPEDLDELVTLLQRLDTRQRNVNASLRKPYPPRSAPPSSGVGTPPHNPLSGGVALPRSVSSSAASPSPLPAAEPMDLSATHRGKLPQAEVTRRMNEGLCRYCGGSGHFAAVCPRKGETKPRTSRLNESSLAEVSENASSSG